jgi:hypothetical protein
MPSNSLGPPDNPDFVVLGPPGTRWGDSRISRAPQWNFSTDRRPLVGMSRTYQGKEVEANNDNKIAGLSPGPMYRPEPGTRVAIPSYSRNSPAYKFGGIFPVIDKRFAPAPGHYGYAAAKALGPQRIDSMQPSKPRWGMGTSTREHIAKLHLHSTSNNSSHILVFNGGEGDSPPLPPAAPAAPSEPSKPNLSRAMAVAMAADQASTDPVLAAALATLHGRVATLRHTRSSAQM